MSTLHSLRSKLGLDRAARYLDSQQPAFQPEFNGDVVSPVYWMQVPFYGRVLRVPFNTCAVVQYPSGRTRTHTSGDHYLDLPQGRHQVVFFDMHQQSTPLRQLRAPSQDAWEVVLDVEAIWRVHRPEEVLGIQGIRQRLSDALSAVIVDYVRSMEHDRLVPVPGGAPVESTEISQALLLYLQQRRAYQGIQVDDILVLSRLGDRRRTETVQKAVVEKTEIDQQRMLQAEHTRLEAEGLGFKQKLAGQQQELAVKEAEIARLKAEEEDKIRLRRAEISATEARVMRAVQLQQVEMQQRAEAQRLQHEQILKSMEVKSKAFSDVAAVLMQTQMIPGLQRSMDGDSREALVHALGSLAEGMPAAISPPPLPEFSPQPVEPTTLRERVAGELGRLMALPGATGAQVEALSGGRLRVTATYLGLRILFELGDEYPQEPPRRISFRKEGAGLVQEVRPDMTGGMGLKEIAQEVAARVSAGVGPVPKRADGNGGETNPPVAA